MNFSRKRIEKWKHVVHTCSIMSWNTCFLIACSQSDICTATTSFVLAVRCSTQGPDGRKRSLRFTLNTSKAKHHLFLEIPVVRMSRVWVKRYSPYPPPTENFCAALNCELIASNFLFSMENLKSCNRSTLDDSCKVHFPQCSHKHGEADFRNGMTTSALQNCPRKEKGLLISPLDGDMSYFVLLHDRENRLAIEMHKHLTAPIEGARLCEFLN